MRSRGFGALALVLAALPAQPASALDAEVANAIIYESIRSYSGKCPCPYSQDSAGRKCGQRSAYSKPGGASPICYPEDVTDDVLQRYLNRR